MEGDIPKTREQIEKEDIEKISQFLDSETSILINIRTTKLNSKYTERLLDILELKLSDIFKNKDLESIETRFNISSKIGPRIITLSNLFHFVDIVKK
jgi:hypothetical protein